MRISDWSSDVCSSDLWSKSSSNHAQILFLVGDAPPHDYADEPDTLATAALAVQQGIIVNTIQSGNSSATKKMWKASARSEGSRVGKECVKTFSTRGSRNH